jgi:hypothetical protein
MERIDDSGFDADYEKRLLEADITVDALVTVRFKMLNRTSRIISVPGYITGTSREDMLSPLEIHLRTPLVRKDEPRSVVSRRLQLIDGHFSRLHHINVLTGLYTFFDPDIPVAPPEVFGYLLPEADTGGYRPELIRSLTLSKYVIDLSRIDDDLADE